MPTLLFHGISVESGILQVRMEAAEDNLIVSLLTGCYLSP